MACQQANIIVIATHMIFDLVLFFCLLISAEKSVIVAQTFFSRGQQRSYSFGFIRQSFTISDLSCKIATRMGLPTNARKISLLIAHVHLLSTFWLHHPLTILVEAG
jgi:hypothetical protein